jgi:hypothetical protein
MRIFLLLLMIRCLLGQNDHTIRKLYENAQFERLIEHIDKRIFKEEMSNNSNRSNNIILLKTLKAKSFYALAQFDSTALIMKLLDEVLPHKFDFDSISNCKEVKCICNQPNIYNFVMDVWEDKRKYFADINITFIKNFKTNTDGLIYWDSLYVIPQPITLNHKDDPTNKIKYFFTSETNKKNNLRPTPPIDILSNSQADTKFIKNFAQFNRKEEMENKFNLIFNSIEENDYDFESSNLFKSLDFISERNDGYYFKLKNIPKDNNWYHLYTFDENFKNVYKTSIKLSKNNRKNSEYLIGIIWGKDWELHDYVDEKKITIEVPDYFINDENKKLKIDNAYLDEYDEYTLIEKKSSRIINKKQYGLSPNDYNNLYDGKQNTNEDFLVTTRLIIDIDSYLNKKNEIDFELSPENSIEENTELNKMKFRVTLLGIITVLIYILL